MSQTETILASLPGDVLGGLRGADRLLARVRQGHGAVPEVVKTTSETLSDCDFDVAICGGTLGIFLGAALQQRGWRVVVIEKGVLRGRDQEWNISRRELAVFEELELLSAAELEQAIASEYNPGRVAFHKGIELWVEDILNVGVDPVYLLDRLQQKFLAAGGTVLENTPFESAIVHPDGVKITAGETTIRARLLVDATGNFSAIALQARQGKAPDGICVVVGSCARGYEQKQNETGDLLASITAIENDCQYFWEAFPARDGRTTYLFTYLDAASDRPGLEFFLDEYFRLLPEYQSVALEQLELARVLFGFFPSYRQSPLRVPWDRVLPVGDSSGMQSPVSFGGFGSMVRHLQRLTLGTEEALQVDLLDRYSLSLLQPYQPNIAATWLFQKTMSVKKKFAIKGILQNGAGNPRSWVSPDQSIPPNRINDLLSSVFAAMERAGDPVLRPFLQDVVQFPALTQALVLTAIARPGLVLSLVPQLGIPALGEWLGHYLNLGLYRGFYSLGEAIAPATQDWLPERGYYFRRWLDAWKYGSGSDYEGS